MREIATTFVSLLSVAWDKIIIHTPVGLVYRLRRPGVAFLVHPRDMKDIYRPFPAFRHLPEAWTRWLGQRFGAITLSRIAAPSDIHGRRIRAELHSIVMDPVAMDTNRSALKSNIRLLSRLSTRKNIRLVALGALLPSVSNYGLDLAKLQRHDPTAPMVTTGHICTAWCISAIFTEIARSRHPSREGFTVGVLGAAGSTGALAAKMLDRLQSDGDWSFGLVLIDKNLRRLARLRDELSVVTEATSDMSALRHCDYVIVVTNSRTLVLSPNDVKPHAVVIDDTQPRATTKQILENAFVVDVLARVGGLDAKFDFGFSTYDRRVTFSCLAEMILVAAVGHRENFALGPGACESPAGIIELFHTYLAHAREAGLDIAPITDMSFSQPMPVETTRALFAPPPESCARRNLSNK